LQKRYRTSILNDRPFIRFQLSRNTTISRRTWITSRRQHTSDLWLQD